MRIVLAIIALGLCGGCVTSLYSWGSFEDSIGRMYGDASFSPNKEISILEAEMDSAASRGRAIPPGEHAHVGYLYYMIGDQANAARHLQAEKELFPESATFIDGLLGRMK